MVFKDAGTLTRHLLHAKRRSRRIASHGDMPEQQRPRRSEACQDETMVIRKIFRQEGYSAPAVHAQSSMVTFVTSR
jgi:hypothetical protein